MKILVTGCMGFIGSNLVPHLLNEGHKVVGIDNLSNSSINPTDRMKAASLAGTWNFFKFYKSDILDRAIMETLFVHEKLDAIIHLAAVGSVPKSFDNPSATVYNNEYGFTNLVQTAAHFGVKRLVFASSSSVYGSVEDEYKTEGREGFPLSPYALSKRMNEDFIRVWAPMVSMNYVGLRFFNVYGPGQSPFGSYAAVIPRFITQATPVVYGDGETTRDFTFVDDVCEAIKKALAYTEKKSTIVNVGKGRGIQLGTILKILKKYNVAEFVDERYGDIKMSIANPTKAREVLGFTAQTPIEVGMHETMEFFKTMEPKVEG